jgi:spore photoproduct lyase
MISYRPSKIVVHEDSWNDEVTREILSRLQEIPVHKAQDIDAVVSEFDGFSDPRTPAKRTLILTRYPGRFMKACPGSGAEICCNYHVINLTSNCHFECTYCVLQSYLNNPSLIVYTNVEDLLNEVRVTLQLNSQRFFRIGTGELADSLAIDDITHFSKRLVPFFAALPNAVLELKTKSNTISNLQDLDHGNHTIISWSVNSKSICISEELKAATMEERLKAARQCQEWGYKVGFHFDPLIYYQGWESEYEETVKDIFRFVDPSMVAWISLGAMRFTPHLREIVRHRFPHSRIPYGEFVPGHHGKLRYFRPIREEIYEKMRGWIHDAAPQVFVYLCMESRAVWECSFGMAPQDCAQLSDQMDALVELTILD